MDGLKWIYNQRGFVVLVESFYLFLLLVIALIYLTAPNAWLHEAPPPTIGPLPVGVPWFGALGAVIISLSGALEHRKDWDPTWNLWHFARPLIGVSLAIVAWLVFQAGILAVGVHLPDPAGATGTAAQAVAQPTNLLYYVIAFVVGYREEIFRDLIKRVADVILTPGGQPPSGGAPLTATIDPTSGPVAGGNDVTVTGSGVAGATSLTFGPNSATFQINADGTILATTPPGTGSVNVTVTTKAGSISAGLYTYV